MRTASDVLDQLGAAGLRDYLLVQTAKDGAVTGRMRIAAINKLKADPRFQQGPLHGLHVDVGTNRTEFRAHRGELGPGSLQIVIDKTTGRFYADIDRASPYSDLVGFVWHSGEVIAGWFRKKKPKEQRIGDEVV
jgi:hypothetical protein